MKRRLLSILLTLCMALSLLPAVAFAEGGAKAIQSGTGSIHGYDTSAGGYSYIYYGTWRNSPIKWRVLDTKANTGAADALFLLTDECLYPLPGDLYACYIQFNPADKQNRHLWKDSTLQGWFKSTFYSGENSAFTSAERALIPATTQASSVFSYKAPGAPSWDPGMRFQICGLEAEHVFAPSIQDVVNAAYGFTDSASRIAGPSNSLGPGTRYWLRSFETSEQLPFMVGENASLMGDWGDNPSAVRPAMNLSTAGNNILFVSAAEGGKPAGGLTEIGEYTGNEWKLTLKDASRSGFSVTTTAVSTTNYGGDIRIEYSGAKTGDNEYIAVLLKDSAGNPTYYGRSAALTEASGTVTIPVAAGLTAGDATLYVYNEQYNGDKMTDLASELKSIPLTVEEAETYTVTYTPGANGTGAEFTATKIEGLPLTLAGESFTRTGYTQTGWATVDGGEKVYDLGAIYEENAPITLYPVWTANQYTVTLDSNGGGAVTPSTVTVTYGEDCPAIPVLQWAGHIFCGWYDAQEGGKQYVNDNGNSTARYDKTENCTLYARWSDAPLCTVTFNPNGGILAGKNTSEQRSNDSVQYKPDDPTREGHFFLGWYQDPACTQRWDFDDWVTGDMTLYAGWRILYYTIYFDTAGGSDIGHITQDYGTAITAPAAPTKTGYTFIGWEPELPATMPAKVMTVTAQWSINQYTITFDTDGGSEVAPITQDYGTAITAPAAPTREGYTFTGWDTAIPATMPAHNMTITAQWTVNQYTITFATDGGSEVAPITQDYGSAITAPAAPTREGYTFTGWDKTIPATMPAGDMTITAQWTVNQYTITYDLDGGTAEGNPDTYTVETDAFTLKNPTRPGYTFTGWSGTGLTGEDNLTVTIPKGSTGNRSYTAHWSLNTYSITYDLNGGTASGNPTSYTVESATITLNQPTKTGYTFTGWSGTDLTGEDNLTVTIPAGSTGDRSYTAHWSLNTYSITYDLDGGTASGNPDFYTVESSTITLNPPTRTGYTFIGWSGTDLSGSDNLTVTIPTGSIGNRSYTAHWSLNTYSIAYDLDGGTAFGNPDSYTVESAAITLNEPTKAGYVFTGWSGTDLVGEDNLTVTIPAGSIGDRRYTAHWEFDPTIIAALNPTPNVDFLDVSRTDWFYYDVRYVCENGLMNGTSRNRFSPYGTATRGMLVTILYRMENEPRCFGSAAFSDVKPGAYYEKAVVWASQNNIVSGYTDGTFRPDAPVTREQLASILYRYTLYRGQDVSAGETTSLTGYGDAQAVSSYALPAMRWACGTGILQGANGKLNPSGLATRAQLAAMLHRYLTK